MAIRVTYAHCRKLGQPREVQRRNEDGPQRCLEVTSPRTLVSSLFFFLVGMWRRTQRGCIYGGAGGQNGVAGRGRGKGLRSHRFLKDILMEV